MKRLLSCVLACTTVVAQEATDTPNLVHRRHMHHHNEAHPTESGGGPRFFTTRTSDVVLPLPTEQDAFTFCVFGDRTGGPDEGVNVLADAVRDVNLFEPDLVMTVGDLIQGYNQSPEWLGEMREYRAIMSELLCPWFPVAGNHDVYWRGPGRPEGEHEDNYETHFGPLWYSFRHKDAHFIVLYTDEGNPDTGMKTFREAEAQRMSEEQLRFLDAALERGRDANHQFVFVHHPRWLEGNYGGDWNENVHPRLVSAGNVTAVFAGHIHRMRSDPSDGIEYVTLATVGGGQSGTVPEAGYLHQYHLVTVRPKQVAMAAVPVGEAMDVRDLTGEVQAECVELAETSPTVDGSIRVASDGSSRSRLVVNVANPTSRAIEYTLAPETSDGRWYVVPDHAHGRIEAGGSESVAFVASRGSSGLDDAFDGVRFVLDRDYLTSSQRYHIPSAEAIAGMEIDPAALPEATMNRAMRLDGEDDAIRVPSEVASVPQGPFTIECWFKPSAFGNRVGLLAKTQNSEYSIFASRGELSFAVHLDGAYRTARLDGALPVGDWHHIAGVYDGRSVALFVDGEMVSRVAVDPSWERTTNDLPLYLGADPGGSGEASSFAEGDLDEVRLVTSAVYTEGFVPQRRLGPVGGTVFHYRLDRLFGPAVVDSGPTPSGARAVGRPRLVPIGE